MSKRFDRWVASPESIALPQAYDEFLDRDELPCLVAGCDWAGRSLGAHMNFAHGVSAREFKVAAGFNLKTGLVGKETAEILREREHIHRAVWPDDESSREQIKRSIAASASARPRVRSLESIEHYKKSRVVAEEMRSPPARSCIECSKEFKQRSVFGHAKFCDVSCRQSYYDKKRSADSAVHPADCVVCGGRFTPTYSQRLRAKKGLPVTCSPQCKGSLNGSRPKPRRSKQDTSAQI